jgi:hypothetical protein
VSEPVVFVLPTRDPRPPPAPTDERAAKFAALAAEHARLEARAAQLRQVAVAAGDAVRAVGVELTRLRRELRELNGTEWGG